MYIFSIEITVVFQLNLTTIAGIVLITLMYHYYACYYNANHLNKTKMSKFFNLPELHLYMCLFVTRCYIYIYLELGASVFRVRYTACDHDCDFDVYKSDLTFTTIKYFLSFVYTLIM